MNILSGQLRQNKDRTRKNTMLKEIGELALSLVEIKSDSSGPMAGISQVIQDLNYRKIIDKSPM